MKLPAQAGILLTYTQTKAGHRQKPDLADGTNVCYGGGSVGNWDFVPGHAPWMATSFQYGVPIPMRLSLMVEDSVIGGGNVANLGASVPLMGSS
jgi:hypothetical protein